ATLDATPTPHSNPLRVATRLVDRIEAGREVARGDHPPERPDRRITSHPPPTTRNGQALERAQRVAPLHPGARAAHALLREPRRPSSAAMSMTSHARCRRVATIAVRSGKPTPPRRMMGSLTCATTRRLWQIAAAIRPPR